METKLTFRSSYYPHRKISLEGTGMVGRWRAFALFARDRSRPTIPTCFPAKNMANQHACLHREGGSSHGVTLPC
ncbi:hypothetical protein JOD24_001500 [Kroppenstedtia sanguinis]